MAELTEPTSRRTLVALVPSVSSVVSVQHRVGVAYGVCLGRRDGRTPSRRIAGERRTLSEHAASRGNLFERVAARRGRRAGTTLESETATGKSVASGDYSRRTG
jgi:hypothetical protein